MADLSAVGVAREAQVKYIKELIDALAQQGSCTEWAISQAMAARIKVEIDALHGAALTWRRRWTDRPPPAC